MNNELPRMDLVSWIMVVGYGVFALLLIIYGAVRHDLLAMVAGLLFGTHSDIVVLNAKLDELRRKM